MTEASEEKKREEHEDEDEEEGHWTSGPPMASEPLLQHSLMP